ncbi:hypothetical protein ACVWXL_004536 [Bradyrhizobium sp. GM22.5]
MPSVISRSPALASSAWAAISFSFCPSSRVARSTLTPPDGIEAEPPGAEARGDHLGVALVDVQALGRHAELLGNDLRIGRLMALPARLGADQDRDIAIGVHPHIGGLLAHGAADLDIARKSDAADQAVLLGRLGTLAKILPLGDLHRALQMRGKVAGIVDLAGRGLVGQRLRLDEILAADGIHRHVEFSRAGVHEAFDDVSSLRPPGAAIGIDPARCW